MDYSKIRGYLKGFPKTEVEVYITYLKHLETDKHWSGEKKGRLKNPWFKYFSEEQASNLYKKVALDGLHIDGDTIILQYFGGVRVSYNYQAYKNRLLIIYPDSKFDLQNVYKGDQFEFRKDSGKVSYTHILENPFEEKRELIGCYCIIKNERGEFIETLNKTEIDKMRAVAGTQKIWQTWYEEMALKSVIKRACKRHFKDIVINMEVLDNENYDLDNATVKPDIQAEIEEAETLDDLQLIYRNHIGEVKDETQFLRMLTKRKNKINENS